MQPPTCLSDGEVPIRPVPVAGAFARGDALLEPLDARRDIPLERALIDREGVVQYAEARPDRARGYRGLRDPLRLDS